MPEITVSTTVRAPVERVWAAYTTPDDIVQWNAASDDWHTTRASVDLRPGGAFSSRMEAKDGSQGFDFGGTYTTVIAHEQLSYEFGDRRGDVTFTEDAGAVTVTVRFDAEDENSIEAQQIGWQAILDRFAAYVTRDETS